MLSLSKFKTNPDLENEGVWIDIGDGAKLKIARSGNKNFRELLKKHSEPFKREIRHNLIDDKKAEEILCKSLSGSVLLGWEGIADENGDQLEYSREKAAEILADPKYRSFRELVIELAEDQELFRQEEIEEVEKN